MSRPFEVIDYLCVRVASMGRECVRRVRRTRSARGQDKPASLTGRNSGKPIYRRSRIVDARKTEVEIQQFDLNSFDDGSAEHPSSSDKIIFGSRSQNRLPLGRRKKCRWTSQGHARRDRPIYNYISL